MIYRKYFRDRIRNAYKTIKLKGKPLSLNSKFKKKAVDYTIHGKTDYGRNLIPYPYHSSNRIVNGITYSTPSKGVVVANGRTSDKLSAFLLAEFHNLPKGKYILSGCPSAISSTTYRLYAVAVKNNTDILSVDDIGSSAIMDLSKVDYDFIRIYVIIAADTIADNLTFNPSFTLLESSYAESTNLITFPYYSISNNVELSGSTVINGITYTINDDGTITANGTATGTSQLFFQIWRHDIELFENMNYRLSGCPTGGSRNTYRFEMFLYNGSELVSNFIDIGEGYIITSFPDKWDRVVLKTYIFEGATANNLIFKPKLEPIYAINNLLPTTFFDSSVTTGGVTCTDNHDGTLTVNGTATENVTFSLSSRISTKLVKGKYILQGCPSGGSNTTYALRGNLYNETTNIVNFNDYGSNSMGDTGSTPVFAVSAYISVNGGTTADNLIFKPELFCIAENIDNLIPYPYVNTTKTENGVTFTDNGDGSITVNGTATAEIVYMLSIKSNGIVGSGIYYLSGCPSGGSATTYMIQNQVDGVWTNPNYDIGEGKIINVQSSITQIAIVIKLDTVIDNLTFHPKLVKLSSEINNVIPYPYSDTTTTSNGVTFTDNHDRSVTVSGTPTDEAMFTFYNRIPVIPNTRYAVYLDCLESATNVVLGLRQLDASDNIVNEGGTDIAITSFTKPYIFTSANNANSLMLYIKRGENDVACSGTVRPFLINLDNRANNLCPSTYRYLTKTVSSVVFADNKDGTITANGTASDDIALAICKASVTRYSSYFLSGCPSSGSDSTYYLEFKGFDADTGNGITIQDSINEQYENNVEIVIKSGTKLDNVTFKPQLMTLDNEQCNVLPQFDFENTEKSGITYAATNLRSVTVNGTATANSFYTIAEISELARGKYCLSGCPADGSNSTYQLGINVIKDGATIQTYADIGSGNVFNFRYDKAVTYDKLELYVYIGNGTTVNNMMFKPKLTKLSNKISNVLPYPYKETTKTINGITFTDNKDGTITINGTATSLATIYLYQDTKTLPNGVSYGDAVQLFLQSSHKLPSRSGNFVLAGFKMNDGSSQPGIDVGTTNAYTDYLKYSKPLKVTTYYGGMSIYLTINSGTTVNNVTVRPTLINLSRNNNIIQPYAADVSYQNGIKKIDNGDGSVTFNGTASDYVPFWLYFNKTVIPPYLHIGDNMICGYTADKSANGIYHIFNYYDSNGVAQNGISAVNSSQYPLTAVSGKHATITEDWKGIAEYVSVRKDTTINNVTVKPVLTNEDKYNKSVFPYYLSRSDATSKGITCLSKPDNVITVNGTATAIKDVIVSRIPVKAGNAYSVGSNVSSDIPRDNTSYQIWVNSSSEDPLVISKPIYSIYELNTVCFVAQADGYVNIHLTIYKDYTMDNVDIKTYFHELDYEEFKKLGVGDKTYNYLQYPYNLLNHSTTVNGVMFTDNGDGTITANGTSCSSEIWFQFDSNIKIDTGVYCLSGCPAGGGYNSYLLSIRDNVGSAVIRDVGTSNSVNSNVARLISNDNRTYNAFIYIKPNTKLDNLVFKPQLTRLSYDNGNIFTYPYTESTISRNGITYSPAADGAIIVTGTATEDSHYILEDKKWLSPGKYYLSGCPAGGSQSTYYMSTQNYNLLGYDFGNGGIINLTSSNAQTDMRIIVKSGTVMNNVVFKPSLIRIGSDTLEVVTYPFSETTKTLNGITFTDKGDKSVTVNGTASDATAFYVIADRNIPKGRYVVGGLPEDGSSSTYQILLEMYKNRKHIGSYHAFNATPTIIDTTTQDYDSVYLMVYISKGATIDNLTFTPQLIMINDESDNMMTFSDTAYTPTNGLEVVRNSSGFFNINGTLTANAAVTMSRIAVKAGRHYAIYSNISKDMPEDDSAYQIWVNPDSGVISNSLYNIKTSPKVITPLKDGYLNIVLTGYKGYVFNNLILTPYFIDVTSREAVIDKSNNILPYPYYERTKIMNGVTFTDNGDGSITVNGTATENTRISLFTRIKVNNPIKLLPKGRYLFVPNCSVSNSNCKLYWQGMTKINALYQSYGSTPFVIDTTDKEYEWDNIFIYASTGTVIDNITFNPVIISMNYEKYQLPSKNLFNFGTSANWYRSRTNTVIDNNNLIVNGVYDSGSSSYAMNTNDIFIKPHETYILNAECSYSATRYLIRVYDADNNILTTGIVGTEYNTYYKAFYTGSNIIRPFKFTVNNDDADHIQIGVAFVKSSGTSEYQSYYNISVTNEADGNIVEPYVKQHNLLPYPYSTLKNSAVLNGVTFTDNRDGSITVNGTNTITDQSTRFKFHERFNIPSGNYISYAYIDDNDIRVTIENGESTLTNSYNTVNNVYIPNDGAHDVNCYIKVPASKTASNVTVKPMLLRTDDLATNILPIPFYEKTLTREGITYTVNNIDGTIIVNGTTGDNISYFIISQGMQLPAGNKYFLSGTPKNSPAGVNITTNGYNGYVDGGSGGALIIITDDMVQTNIVIKIAANTAVDNLVFKPRLIPVQYEPYGYKIPIVNRSKNLLTIPTVTSTQSNGYYVAGSSTIVEKWFPDWRYSIGKTLKFSAKCSHEAFVPEMILYYVNYGAVSFGNNTLFNFHDCRILKDDTLYKIEIRGRSNSADYDGTTVSITDAQLEVVDSEVTPIYEPHRDANITTVFRNSPLYDDEYINYRKDNLNSMQLYKGSNVIFTDTQVTDDAELKYVD